MRNLSRERGQGATEYILIIALAIVFIVGLVYVFRSSIGSTTEKMTAVVSGKTVQTRTAADASASPSNDNDQSAENSQGGEDGSGSSPAGQDSSAAGKDSPEETSDDGAVTANKGSGSSAGSTANGKIPRGSARGMTIWFLVAIAAILVLVVGYFLSASSR